MRPADFEFNVGESSSTSLKGKRKKMPLAPKFVEETTGLDIRKLAAEGLLAPGTERFCDQRVFNGRDWQTVRLNFLMERASGVIEVFSNGGMLQSISVVRQRNKAGKSNWVFLRRGGSSLKLHFGGYGYGSRQELRLKYQDQSESRTARHLRWISEGPAGEDVPIGLKPRRGRPSTPEELEFLERALIQELLARAEKPILNARKRRASFEKRVLQSGQMMSASGRTELARTQADYLSLLEAHQRAHPAWSGPPAGHFQDDKRAPTPRKSYLDLAILKRLAVLRPGELTMAPLAWPSDWLPDVAPAA